MKTIWENEARLELLNRADHLNPALPAQWGKMNCPKMLAHVTDGVRMALGEMEVAAKNTPMKFAPIRHLIIHWLPFPKGAPTAPELLERIPGEWEQEITEFRTVLDRLATNSQKTRWPEHPAFGRLSTKDWGVLIYRHIDHHFKQFGV